VKFSNFGASILSAAKFAALRRRPGIDRRSHLRTSLRGERCLSQPKCPPKSRPGIGTQFARIGRNESGATLVEFSLVALPFLLLLLGTFEIGFIYWANKELESATTDAVRLVRTGQAQAANMTAADLKANMCSRTAVLVHCTERMRIDVRSAETFAGITPPDPLDGEGGLKSDADFAYAPGAAEDVVLVSAFFDWPKLFFNNSVLRAAVPARNEPF
jgi:Flp pilus assembly protein TadG